MKKKPLSLNVIAFCYLMAPLFNLFQMAWLNHWPLTGPRGVIGHLGSYEWTVFTCFPLVAFGVFRVAKWGYFFFVLFSVFLITHNFIAYIAHPYYSLYVVLLFQFVTMGFVGFFLQKHISAPYFNPSLKWWEHPHRYISNVSAVVRVRQIMLDGKVLDISTGGCFISTSSQFRLGEPIELTLAMDHLSVNIAAKVVWMKKKKPLGYGIMFTKLDRRKRQDIGNLIGYIRSHTFETENHDQNIKTA